MTSQLLCTGFRLCNAVDRLGSSSLWIEIAKTLSKGMHPEAALEHYGISQLRLDFT